MNQSEIIKILRKLNIDSIDVVESHEFDREMGVLCVDLKHNVKAQVETVNGYMQFDCNAIDFTPMIDRVCFLFDENPYLETYLGEILDIKFV